jgi:hypothetical protein
MPRFSWPRSANAGVLAIIVAAMLRAIVDVFGAAVVHPLFYTVKKQVIESRRR